MRSLLFTWVMRWAYRLQNEGRFEPVLRLVADDATLVFPGANRWGGTYNGKAQLRNFMQELYRLGLQFTVHDVLVKGWPWNMSVVVVISDRALGADGEVAYANRAVEIWRVHWFKIVSGELFEDTELATAWDKRLSAQAARA